MFPQFGATAESLSKASSLVFRIGTDAHLYDDPDDVSIAPLLDSRYDSEKVEALKRLLALIAQGSDVSNFFPQVVKNVASQTSEVKKLVYLYLLHYAEKRPNEALLSINCFQKDLSDPNPLVRAWALRTMAGIRLHAIAPLVLVAANKCAKDPSVYVRKCAANALPKLNDLRQEENVATLEELVSVLLSDHSPAVIGAAAAAYNSVCPHNLSLIGRKFRRLCEALPDVEEWGQVILIEILLRYVVARHGLVRESIMFSLNKTMENDITNDPLKPYDDQHILYAETCGNKSSVSMLRSYIEGSEEYLSQLDCSSKNSALLDSDAFTPKDNTDVKLLLQCTSPLLWSQNSSVILAAAGVHWIMAPRDDVKKIVKPLLFLLRSSHSSKFVVLCNIQLFAKATPSLFAPYYEDFFVCSSDLYQIRALKLEILANVVTDSSIAHIFHEFQDYVKDPDRRFAADTVAAIGLCAQKIPSVANTCLGGLLALIKEESTISCSGPEGEASILVQAIVSIKAVIAQNPINNEKVIIQLARCLDSIKYPSARALIIWLVGEYSSVGPTIRQITPIILKYLARFFTSEEVETKQQILNAAAKVLLSGQGDELLMFKTILKYLLELAKYDSNYDVRNRAHLMEKLLEFPATSCQQEHIPCPFSNKVLSYDLANYIFSGKLHLVSPQLCSYRAYLPGSLSQVVLHAAPGYEPLPKPGSLIVSDMFPEANMGEAGAANSSIADSTDSDTLSGSSEEESDYDSNSRVDSERSESLDNLHENGQLSQDDKNHQAGTSQLICLDAGVGHHKTRQDTDSDLSAPPTDLSELMSKTAFESWLEEQPSTSGPSSSVDVSGSQAIVKISLKEIAVNVSPKVHNLLEPVNGDGLSVDYSFSSEMSNVSPFLVCVELVFHNLSTDSLTNITLEDVDQGSESVSHTFQPPESHLYNTGVPKMIPIEEIASLLPNQKAKRTLQVQFHHHLLPLKLAIICCEKKYPVKLQPDIGYFVKPLQMDLEAFTLKENQLRGMFEYSRRCTFSSPEGNQFSASDDKILGACRSLASKFLSNANLAIVSIDMHVSSKVDYISGLCMRFCGQKLSTSKPCLVTITADGKCYEPLDLNIKVNCEETVFGLNFLNKTVASFS